MKAFAAEVLTPCDLEQQRRVAYEEGASFARAHNLLFVETSASTGHMVDGGVLHVRREGVRQHKNRSQGEHLGIPAGLYDLSDESSGVKVGGPPQQPRPPYGGGPPGAGLCCG
ncbi:unnamed protein product [Prorocentrum cordatum]|uniref:Uncharacterized protein n=1 Tax=Prorocentrum cordatum TaxID=2364126 RepID=A0ABN9W2R9_9DINO|nr:unnamed protein product [Polarella glacialis]